MSILAKYLAFQDPPFLKFHNRTEIRLHSMYYSIVLNLSLYFFLLQVFVFVILFLYCLITSPMLLIVMAISGGLCYYLSSKNVRCSCTIIKTTFCLIQTFFKLIQTDRKIILGGREVSLAQQYGVVAVCSVPMFLFAGAGKIILCIEQGLSWGI